MRFADFFGISLISRAVRFMNVKFNSNKMGVKLKGQILGVPCSVILVLYYIKQLSFSRWFDSPLILEHRYSIRYYNISHGFVQ